MQENLNDIRSAWGFIRNKRSLQVPTATFYKSMVSLLLLTGSIVCVPILHAAYRMFPSATLASLTMTIVILIIITIMSFMARSATA